MAHDIHMQRFMMNVQEANLQRVLCRIKDLNCQALGKRHKEAEGERKPKGSRAEYEDGNASSQVLVGHKSHADGGLQT